MSVTSLIRKINFNSLGAWHLATYEYEGPYASIDAAGFASLATSAANDLLATTTIGIILDPITGTLREGAENERGFGEVYFAPQPCESIAHGPQRREKQESRNRLRVDYIESGIVRCIMRPYNKKINAINWLGSGGGVEVFDQCVGRESELCPRHRNFVSED